MRPLDLAHYDKKNTSNRSKLTTAEPYQDYARFVQLKGLRERSVNSYLGWVGQLAEYFPNHSVPAIDLRQVLEFLVHLQTQRTLDLIRLHLGAELSPQPERAEPEPHTCPRCGGQIDLPSGNIADLSTASPALITTNTTRPSRMNLRPIPDKSPVRHGMGQSRLPQKQQKLPEFARVGHKLTKNSNQTEGKHPQPESNRQAIGLRAPAGRILPTIRPLKARQSPSERS